MASLSTVCLGILNLDEALTREDENAQRLGVGVSAVGCGSEEDCGKEKFHAPSLAQKALLS